MDLNDLVAVVDRWREQHPEQGIVIALGEPHTELVSQDNKSVHAIVGANGRDFSQGFWRNAEGQFRDES